MKIIIKRLKKKKDYLYDIELSNRLSKFVEKQNIVEVIDKFSKLMSNILKL